MVPLSPKSLARSGSLNTECGKNEFEGMWRKKKIASHSRALSSVDKIEESFWEDLRESEGSFNAGIFKVT